MKRTPSSRLLLPTLLLGFTGEVGSEVYTHLSVEGTGLDFENHVSKATVIDTANLLPSGLAAGDVDGDGLCDLYFCSLDGENALFRNLGGWRFERVEGQPALACAGRPSIGATFADLDGDGDLDLVVTARGGPNSLFVNDGSGGFAERPEFAGEDAERGSTSIAVADLEGDGDLDLYLCNYLTRSYSASAKNLGEDEDLKALWERARAGESVLEFERRFYVDYGEFQERGEPDLLLLNDGAGGFAKADIDLFEMAPGSPRPDALSGWGLAAQFRDIDGDGAPELYVCNDFHTPDRLWLNRDGRLVLAPVEAQRKMSYFSMAVDWADIDLDGALDFFVGDMLSRDHARRKRQMGDMVTDAPQNDPLEPQPQVMQNTLFRNRGDGTFAEISGYAGLRASEWTWGAIFTDADLDGRQDLLVSCGMIHDLLDADTANDFRAANPDATPEEIRANRVIYPRIETRNPLFRNLGGLRFEEVGETFGLRRAEVSGGMVLADLDNDLDLDLVISNTGAPPEVYRNDSAAPRIGVRLRGKAPNTAGIGARVELLAENGPTQQQEVIAGGRFASGCDTALAFATPEGWGPFRLRVRWRSGRVSELVEVVPGRLYTPDETGAAASDPPDETSAAEPLFEDRSGALGHRHEENDFDDFAVQPLLPNRLSRLGPGVGWIDLDADGDDDIVLGAPAGGRLGIYENLGDGRLKRIDHELTTQLDLTGIAGYAGKGGGGALLCGVSSFEDPEANAGGQVFDLPDGENINQGAALAADGDSTGPVALADVDGDGDLDVFLGGRFRIGRYPEAADSRILLNGTVDGGAFKTEVLEGIGLVSGATFADIDSDGDADLLLAREWGSPALLENTGTGLVDATERWGLAGFKGWWNGITAADLDADGRLDLAVTNWGTNSKYEGAYGEGRPLSIYYGDLDGSGTFDIVEAHEDKFTRRLVPERGLSCSSRAMPFVRRITPTFREFGDSGLVDIYGPRLDRAGTVEASELRSLIFLNRGARMEPRPLPPEAQFAPAFGASVADFDGDGNEDLFLAQNFFSVQIETPRNDAGRGLVLLGDGAGGFEPMSAMDSGIVAYGEGRGTAIGDFDCDGRVDLLLGQSGGKTRLWRNLRARPGLRVRLDGGRLNPHGFGATVRAVYTDGTRGPLRSLVGGSGYWSQDSAVVVLPAPRAISTVEVFWPGGERTSINVDEEEREIEVRRE